VEIVAIDTPSLGDRSYLAHDGTTALVVDPQRDIDRVLALAAERGVRIAHVAETHLHNDYLTGGLALARATGAAYYVSAADEVAFDRVPVKDGDVIEAGPVMRARALATPGHTVTHLSYALEAGGQPVAVFTGGSLLFGTTGRPDLLGPAHTRGLAHAQWGSARRLAADLPDEAAVYPTHGFGSFCSVTPPQGTSSTIGRERRVNPVLTQDEQRYVSDLLSALDVFPAYYAHMGPANAAGPSGPDLSPPGRADAAGLRQRIDAGEWVVDLRPRRAFASGHVAGVLNFGLDGSFAAYLGWLIPWGTPVTLLGETPDQVAEAQRELVRIGIDRPDAAAAGAPGDWSGGQPLRSFPVADFAGLAAVRRDRPVPILDVRRDREWEKSHIEGAVHIPLHELAGHLDQVPAGEVWVHCHSGYRATIAASILEAAGRPAVAVDDDFGHAGQAGLPVAGLRAAGGAGVLHLSPPTAAHPQGAPFLGRGAAPDAGRLTDPQGPVKALPGDQAPGADRLGRRHVVERRAGLSDREKPLRIYAWLTARCIAGPVIIHNVPPTGNSTTNCSECGAGSPAGRSWRR
jgi:hydroxyacylglutathione hydrolase